MFPIGNIGAAALPPHSSKKRFYFALAQRSTYCHLDVVKRSRSPLYFKFLLCTGALHSKAA
jgi:hypothetical protein